jgi:hypothetical protein
VYAEFTEEQLRAMLLRAYVREGSMFAAIAAFERERGRPLLASPGFLLEVEGDALVIDEVAEAMYALICRAGASQAQRKGARGYHHSLDDPARALARSTQSCATKPANGFLSSLR